MIRRSQRRIKNIIMRRLLIILIAFLLAVKAHAQSPTVIDEDKIYTSPVEVMPQYKDGESRLNFRLNHIRYLFVDRMKDIQGRVLVAFVIEKDGSISNAKMVQGLTEEQDKEVLRVI